MIFTKKMLSCSYKAMNTKLNPQGKYKIYMCFHYLLFSLLRTKYLVYIINDFPWIMHSKYFKVSLDLLKTNICILDHVQSSSVRTRARRPGQRQCGGKRMRMKGSSLFSSYSRTSVNIRICISLLSGTAAHIFWNTQNVKL